MQITIQTQRGVKHCFSQLPEKIMDFFLSHADMYHTPTTIALNINEPVFSVRDYVNILRKNSYVTKMPQHGNVFHITRENMEFWRTDFKNHIMSKLR